MKYNYTFYLPEKYKIRGFEEELAFKELSTLFGGHFEKSSNTLSTTRDSKLDEENCKRLTFIEKVHVETDREETIIEPYQVDVNRTASLNSSMGNNITHSLFSSIEVNRRTHNYLSHSIHQYKGKFYPQIAKSLFNILGLKNNSVVLEPFAGSGTTLVECFLNGFTGIGLDLNPLAVLITRAKIEILEIDPSVLESEISRALSRIQIRYRKFGIFDKGLDDFSLPKSEDASKFQDFQLPNSEYLSSWFEPIPLKKFEIILNEIDKIQDAHIRNFARVVLSNLVRAYSLQAPGQLRVRRRKTPPSHDDLLLKYRKNLFKHIRGVSLAKKIGIQDRLSKPEVKVFQGDTRYLQNIPSKYCQEDGLVDAIITSPPYATALPYIDTDRLTLFMFDEIDKTSKRDLEWNMIGNREITQKQRKEIENEFLSSSGDVDLPKSVNNLVNDIYDLNINSDVGFRRKNKASLLYKYFVDMKLAFLEFNRVLRPSGKCSIIIGNSKTKAGGKMIDIKTGDLLIDIGNESGFHLTERIAMTDQPAYMAHSKNVIDTETIFIMEKS